MGIRVSKPLWKTGLAAILSLTFATPVSAIVIRQEINILNHVVTSTTAVVTSSEIVNVSTTAYTATSTWYFEIVATSTATSTVTLRRANSSTDEVSITIPTGTTSMTRFRSASFSPTSTDYILMASGTATGGKTVRAARLINIQSSTNLQKTETQIEIGNYETDRTNTATSTGALSAPKYWYFHSSSWDGTVTAYAEVVYRSGNSSLASSTTFNVSGTWTVPSNISPATATIEAWGGGGGGGAASTNNSGSGSGGAGGAYSILNSTSVTPSAGYTVVVGNGGPGGVSTAAGTRGSTSTFNGVSVVAVGGAGGGPNSGAKGVGTSTGSIGTTKYRGGSGATGTASGVSGAGGEGACSTGNGNDATSGTGGSGCDGGDGASGRSDDGAGNAGSAPGGGGAGGRSTGTPNRNGGAGADGRVKISYTIVESATTTIILQRATSSFNWVDDTVIVQEGTAQTSTRVRVGFTPSSSAPYYRIVAKISTQQYDIYSGKIIVNQNGNMTGQQSQTTGTSPCPIQGNGGVGEACGQSFNTDSNSWSLTSVEPYLTKWGTPTDDLTVSVYSDSAFTISLGSKALSSSAIVANDYNMFTFNPSIVLSASTTYYIGLERSGARDTSNYFRWSESAGNPFASGVLYDKDNGSWTTRSSNDTRFKLNYTYVVSLLLLEPQYLLGNTVAANTSSNQGFLQYWDPAEWVGTTFSYTHQVEASSSATTTAVLKDLTSPQILNTITGATYLATSSLSCVPVDAATLDYAATQGAATTYADRILVGVGQTQTASCSAGPVTAVATPRFWLNARSWFGGSIWFR